MAGQNYTYPAGSAISLAAEGTNNAAAPSQSLLVAGIYNGNLTPLALDSSSNLKVNINASSGTVSTNLAQVGGASIALGQAAMAASLPVVIASNQSAVPISAASLPLPSGASTSALQSQLSAQIPTTLGQHLMAASLSIAVASDQSAIPVSAGSLPLPTGAATSANQTNGSQKSQVVDGSGNVISSTGNALDVNLKTSSITLPVSAAALPLPSGASTSALQTQISGQLPATLGQKAMTASLAVVVASDQSAVPVSAASLPLPSGAATSALQTSGNTSLTSIATNTANIPAKGQAAMSASTPVAIASDQSNVPTSQGGRAQANAPVRNDYSSVNVTTSAFVQLIASTTSTANMLEIFDSSGQVLGIATGAAASEVIQFYVYPGGNGQVPFKIASGTRVSIKAISANATSGQLVMNLYT